MVVIMLSEYYFVSYMRKNGKQVDEMFSNYSEANSRRNILINEFGYSEIEVKLTCKFM